MAPRQGPAPSPREMPDGALRVPGGCGRAGPWAPRACPVWSPPFPSPWQCHTYVGPGGGRLLARIGAPAAAAAFGKPSCGLPSGQISGFQINAAPLLSPGLAASPPFPHAEATRVRHTVARLHDLSGVTKWQTHVSSGKTRSQRARWRSILHRQPQPAPSGAPGCSGWVLCLEPDFVLFCFFNQFGVQTLAEPRRSQRCRQARGAAVRSGQEEPSTDAGGRGAELALLQRKTWGWRGPWAARKRKVTGGFCPCRGGVRPVQRGVHDLQVGQQGDAHRQLLPLLLVGAPTPRQLPAGFPAPTGTSVPSPGLEAPSVGSLGWDTPGEGFRKGWGPGEPP